MPKKIDLLIRIFLLVLLPAFIMRPVVVSVHNADNHSNNQQGSSSCSSHSTELSTHPLTLRSIEREAPDVISFIPCISKECGNFLPDSSFKPVSSTCISFQKSPLVLRIWNFLSCSSCPGLIAPRQNFPRDDSRPKNPTKGIPWKSTQSSKKPPIEEERLKRDHSD